MTLGEMKEIETKKQMPKPPTTGRLLGRGRGGGGNRPS